MRKTLSILIILILISGVSLYINENKKNIPNIGEKEKIEENKLSGINGFCIEIKSHKETQEVSFPFVIRGEIDNSNNFFKCKKWNVVDDNAGGITILLSDDNKDGWKYDLGYFDIVTNPTDKEGRYTFEINVNPGNIKQPPKGYNIPNMTNILIYLEPINESNFSITAPQPFYLKLKN